VINVFREQVGMFQEDVALPLIRQLDQHTQVRAREQGHWSVLLTGISWEWGSMETTNYRGALQNLTDRDFHCIVALHLLNVHILFQGDNNAAFAPLLRKTPLAKRTAQSHKVLTGF
jgi:hypothetical protein